MAEDKRRVLLVAEMIPVEQVMHEVIAFAWVRWSHEAMRLHGVTASKGVAAHHTWHQEPEQRSAGGRAGTATKVL